MKQTKIMSIIEAATNTIVGLIINIFVNIFVFNTLLGCGLTIEQSALVAVLFVVISVVRGYALRRFFNFIS